MKRILLFCLVAILICLPLQSCNPEDDDEMQLAAKPVIYLYPERVTDVTVTLDFKGRLTTTYPEYHHGWNVTAHPDGTIYMGDQSYSYLYWEGVSDVRYDFSEGFVVKGEDTADFLEDTLTVLGLNRREANEFIVYWLPKMERNAYNLISFQKEAYTDHTELTIAPEPDSVLRVFMAWMALNEAIEIPKQTLSRFERTGFTVIEWGGTEVVRTLG